MGRDITDQITEVIMRVFAVIFVLAVLSGCHARSVPQDEWKNPWEVTVDKFNDYLTDLNTRAEEMVHEVRSSQISRELDTLIQDSMSELAIQGRPGDQAGALHPGGRRAYGQRPAEDGRQTPRTHDGGSRADGEVRRGAADHDGAERRGRQGQSLRLHPQAEETPQQGHSGDQETS